MTLQESYDIVNGKYKKDNSDFKYYTDVETFQKIVSTKYIKGRGFWGNTYTYGKKDLPKGTDNEVCLVRSDRSPDTMPGFELSPDIGDIKFCFSKDKLEQKFGKVKPIDEYPTEAISYLRRIVIDNLKNKYISDWWKKYHYTEAIKKINELKNYYSLSDKRKKQLVDDLTLNYTSVENGNHIAVLSLNGSRYLKDELKKNLKNWNGREKMESRVRLKDKEQLPINLANKVMIPDYLQNDPKIKLSVLELKKQNIPVEIYKCKYPREKERYLDKLSKK